MEETYTAEVEQRDLARTAELLARFPKQDASAAMELMSISYRAGIATGERRAAWSLLASVA